jgi:hypothetical protein
MKDLDFDELDKAVSSLMGSVPASGEPAVSVASTSAATDELKTTTTPTPAEGASSTDSPSPAEEGAAVELKETTPTVRPSSGRFMDVVHPSSDMKLATKPTQSREGTAIVPPVSTESQESTPELTQSEAAAAVELATEPNTEAISENQPTEAPVAWPDPINLATQEQDNTPIPAPESSEPAPTAPPVDVASVMQGQESEQEKSEAPLQSPTSPFLPDAKVEKRPLGGSEEEALTGTEIASTDSHQELEATPPEAIETMPAELSQDVLAIESGGATEPAANSVEGVNASGLSEKPEVSGSIDQAASGAGAAVAVAAGGSIAQQYKAKPSSGNQHHEALYDAASNDTAALQHPVKKKSGWLVVLWVVLLIALGVGGALALYFFKVI